VSTQFYRAGGLVTDTASDIILLRAAVQTSGRVSTLRLAKPYTAGYAVTTGKTFYVCKVHIGHGDVSATAVNDAVGLGYSDTDLGLDVTTARTNPVAIYGDPEAATAALCAGFTYDERAVGVSPYSTNMDSMIIPAGAAGKYMYVKAFFTTAPIDVKIWGFER
jgi:hypothetical protein